MRGVQIEILSNGSPLISRVFPNGDEATAWPMKSGRRANGTAASSPSPLPVGSESVALRVDDEHDQDQHDETKLRQSNACEHRHPRGTSSTSVESPSSLAPDTQTPEIESGRHSVALSSPHLTRQETPEKAARRRIDAALDVAGWQVQDATGAVTDTSRNDRQR
jgi:hypothetical protein